MTHAVPPPASATAGGVVFRVKGRRFFLAADVALRLAPQPQITRFPGAPPGLLGLALSDGVTLPVVEIGPAREAMIVCLYRGEPIGLLGAEEVTTGMFAAGDAGGVLASGEAVPPLDLEEICGRIHVVTWGASWGG